jgi:hypothetical protein
VRILHSSYTLGFAGRKNSTPSLVCHGHAGGTRSGQTRKTPKDLSAHESEKRGRGESVGFMLCTYKVFLVLTVLAVFVYYESMKRNLIYFVYPVHGLVVYYESRKRELKT